MLEENAYLFTAPLSIRCFLTVEAENPIVAALQVYSSPLIRTTVPSSDAV